MSEQPQSTADPHPPEDLARLRQWLEHAFSKRELTGLSLDLGIDPDNLPGETKSDLARELVAYCSRRGRLADLETAAGQAESSRQDTLAAYRQRLLEETRYVLLKGIPTPPDRHGRLRDLQLPLDHVYIRLQAAAEKERRRQEDEEARALAEAAQTAGPAPPEKERISSQEFLATLRTLGEYLYRQGQLYQAEKRPEPVDPQAALAEHGRLVVLGAPGAGKSTMLRFLARRAAEDRAAPIPVLVSLRDFAHAHAQDRQLSLLRFALAWASAGNDMLQQALEAAAGQGRVLWLLDALDEARDLAGEAARQAARLPGRFILTSRPVGYAGLGLQSLPHFEVLPLAPDDVAKFLRDWFGFLAGDAVGAGNGETKVAALEKQLAARPRLQALTRNPLLLTFLVTLASRENEPELPARRAALYARYVAELAGWEIERRRQAQNTLEAVFRLGPLQGDAARRAAQDGFCYLGWALHLAYYGGHSAAAPTPEALAGRLSGCLAAAGYPEPEELARAVLDFWQEAGILDVWAIGQHSYLAFRHLSFQEYAAAWALARAWQRDSRRAWRFLFPRLHHYAWREPVLLLAGLMDEAAINALARRLLRGRSPEERTLHHDLRLAALLLAEGAPLDERLSQRLLRRLEWLGRRQTGKRATILWAMYLLGLLALYRSFPFWGCLIGGILWTLTWYSSFIRSRYPRIQGLLAWPSRVTKISPEPQLFIQLLGQAGRPAIARLERCLRDRNGEVRRSAAEALGQIGKAAIPSLMAALQDKDWVVRQSAAEALGQIGEAALSPLLAALEDSNSVLRGSAADALGRIGEAAAAPPLIAALRDNEREVRGSAARALGRIGEATAVHPLISALQDSDWIVRRSAAGALGQIGDAAAVPPLFTALQDSESRVRDSAADALEQIGEAAVPALIAALQDRESRVRQSAADALGQIGEAAAMPFLIAALNDSSVWVRSSAAQALGQIGDDGAVPWLIAAFQDSRGDVIYSAAAALGQIGAAAVPALFATLQDSDEWVCRSAAQALGRIGDAAAVTPLIAALQDSHLVVRNSAAEALGRIGDAAAVPPLIAALGDSHELVRRSAAEALGRIGEATAVQPLIAALQDSDERVRRIVAEALGRIGDTAALPPLVAALQDRDSELRRSAAGALGQIGDAAAVRPLIATLQDSDSVVRRSAAKALEQISNAIEDERLLERARRALWWRLTDSGSGPPGGTVAEQAYEAMEIIAGRLVERQFARRPLDDPLCQEQP
ncbi:MAG: HEAT repeat domain-containing protein [Chloroflexi bacterium]|nr:HEAT repeat domain-containing protein [Chloroflexota bacterium]MCI0646427.1 HEAT repeat domain-containing protein [Chloroflexota bacterium]MCI0730187.1 HEAT repeat domain-containing protein [Chloroflexota bacterium]